MLCNLQEAAYYLRILVTNFPVCVWKVEGRIPIPTQPIIKHQQNLQQFNSILTLYIQRWYQITQVEGSAIQDYYFRCQSKAQVVGMLSYPPTIHWRFQRPTPWQLNSDTSLKFSLLPILLTN